MIWTLLDEVGAYQVWGRNVPGGVVIAVVSPTLAGGSGVTFVPGTDVADIQAAWGA